jgi:6-phosphogluconolactonase
MMRVDHLRSTGAWQVFPEFELMSVVAAAFLARAIETAVDRNGVASVVFSGGSTPGRTYELLAEYALPWERVHFFFSDERLVPREDPLNNYGLAYRTLFSTIVVPEGNLHPFPTEISPDKAVQGYEEEIREFFGMQGLEDPRFDLALLGMGRDGHTASLFPGRPSMGERDRLVVHEPNPNMEPLVERLTMTFAALNRAHEVLFIVSGKEKEQMVERIRREPEEAARTIPAAMVRPMDGNVTWLIARR